jgi:hypothetical protein
MDLLFCVSQHFFVLFAEKTVQHNGTDNKKSVPQDTFFETFTLRVKTYFN